MPEDRLSVTQTQRKAIGIAIVLALLGGALFLRPYFSLIVVAIIFAFLFNPFYSRLLKKWNNPGRASMLTFLFALVATIVPVILIILFSVKQVDNLVNNTDFTEFSKTLTNLMADINAWLARFSIHIDGSKIGAQLSSVVKTVGQSLFSGIPELFSSFIGFITSAIIFIYVFLSLLKNSDKVLGLIRVLNPLGEQISNLYITKMSAMTKATVRGQFIIAFCQGLESAIVLSIAGLSHLFFFFLVTLTALSVVPMGAGIVTIPIGIVLILTGHVWEGVLIIANHLIIVTNIDNVLRPKLVPREARLDPALMILAVFSGVAYFGFMGIVLGPVLMIVIVTTIEVYLEVYRGIHSKDEKGAGAKKSFYTRVRHSAKRMLNRSKPAENETPTPIDKK